MIVHNQREYEQQIDFDRLPPDWKVIDLIRVKIFLTQIVGSKKYIAEILKGCHVRHDWKGQ